MIQFTVDLWLEIVGRGENSKNRDKYNRLLHLSRYFDYTSPMWWLISQKYLNSYYGS